MNVDKEKELEQKQVWHETEWQELILFKRKRCSESFGEIRNFFFDLIEENERERKLKETSREGQLWPTDSVLIME